MSGSRQEQTVADAIRSIGITEVTSVHAGACRAVGCATLARSADRAPASAQANLELTFAPDHSMGADHPPSERCAVLSNQLSA